MNPNSSANLVSEIGARIREARREAGWTQAELAKRGGLNRSFLGAMDRCTRNSSLETLVKIAKALKAEPQWLVPPGTLPPRKS